MFAWHDTPWMWLWMVVVWSLFAVFAYRLLRGRSTPTAPRRDASATEILEQRFARGEISAEEYGERRDTLAETRTPSRPL